MKSKMKRCGHHAAEYGPRKSSRLSGNAPKMIMVDDDVTRQLFICRSAFARYLQRAADAVDNLEEPTYVTIRGIHQWSLSMELQLSTRQYSAILIGCGLVEEYGDTVRMNKDGWNFFLENYALRCPVTKEGVCETTRGKIKYNALQLGMIANDDDMRPMELLRIGRNKEGETIVPTQQMNGLDKNSDEYKTKLSEKKDAESCRDGLLNVKKAFEDEIARLKKAIKDAPTKLTELRKARKLYDDSLYSQCEEIFRKWNVERGSYHGGNFNGVNIIRLMLKANVIMNEVEALVTAKGREDTKEKGKALCEDVRYLLQAWDSIFAKIHEKDPSDEFCNELQKDIDAVMKKWRELKLSVTPKGHGIEMHVTCQMRKFPGGISLVLEYWVEHAHQIGGKKDSLWKSQPMSKQGELGAKRDLALRLEQTLDATRKVNAAFTRNRKQKQSTIDADNIKKEGRNEAIDKFRAQLEDAFTLADLSAVIDANN